MKPLIRSSSPFAIMFLLAIGSVIVSCTSFGRAAVGAGKPSSINTGADAAGRFYTVQVMDRIDKVVLMDSRDKSRRTEVRPGGWTYDPLTTEIAFTDALPYRTVVVHVEGGSRMPPLFVLRDVQGSDEDLLVVVGGRLGIPGFDYTWDRTRGFLELRADIDLEKDKYYVSYNTSIGSGCMGNWEPGSEELLAYVEAEHRARTLKRQLASRETDWFLDPDTPRGRKPELVSRPFSPEERREMESLPVPVIKMRFTASEESLSREVGFDARASRQFVGADGARITAMGRMIEETARSGRLSTCVVDYYHRENSADDGPYDIQLRISNEAEVAREQIDERFVIDRATLDLGTAIERTCLWATRGGPYGKPDVVALSTYAWEDRGVFFEVSCDTGRGPDAELLIAETVKMRKVGLRKP